MFLLVLVLFVVSGLQVGLQLKNNMTFFNTGTHQSHHFEK